KRQQGDVAGLLDGRGQTALVRHAHAGQTPRHDLAALGHKLSEQAVVLVVDGFDLLDAELANFLAPEVFATAFAATRPARSTRTRSAAISAAIGTIAGDFPGSCCRSGFVSHDAPQIGVVLKPCGERFLKWLCRRRSGFARGGLRGYSRGRGGLFTRLADLLDLVETLLLLVDAHGQELDDRFADPQTALELVDQAPAAFDNHQDVNA